jgi:hypothetical protein
MTSIEWLIEELTPSIALQQKYIDELKEKAKKMHKQEVMNNFNQGHREEISDKEIQLEAIKRSSKYQDSNLFENTWEEAIEWYKEKLQSLKN